MENNEKDQVFVYTYSAPQNDEVKKIRERYLPKEETKLEQLRRLDESTTKKGTACSLFLGAFSSLILGVGMCCVMLWDSVLLIPGIIIGSIGILGMALAYPAYASIIRKERERIAPKILRLTNELLGSQA